MKLKKLIITISVMLSLNYLATSIVRADASDVCSRDDFKHWVDADNDGEDTRLELLNSNYVIINKKVSWICPYTGKIFNKVYKLDIDHIVPLVWACKHGANEWSLEKKEKFANDEENLLAVYRSANRSKKDKGPDEWLPPNLTYCTEYINRFIYICDKYALPYDASQFKKMIYFCKKNEKGIKINKIKETLK